MWARVSDRGRWALVVLAAAIALLALDAWWIATYRHGFPLDIDEAGYMSFAFNDYLGLKLNGLHGWWDTIQGTPVQAPLTTALASLVLVVKQGTLAGFVVLAGFLVVLTMAVYGIAERLAGPRLGALAAIIVATSEGAFLQVHHFVFALPAAALLACAVYALLRSEGMRWTRWALACGVAIGLMLLARTMTAAFVPGIVAGALVALLTRPREDWLPGALNIAVATVAAFAVAATWYWRNLDSVVDYLTSYGYGSKSANYGASHSIVSWEWWHSVATRIASADLLIPLTAIVLAGLVAVAVEAVGQIRGARDRAGTALRIIGSDAFSVAIVFAAGYLALSTSRNTGSGFTFPIAILLPPIAVIALRLHKRAVVPVIAALAIVAAINVLANSSLSETMARERSVDVPLLGTMPWISGVPRAVKAIRVQVPGPETRFDDQDRGWPRADVAFSRYVFEELSTAIETPVVAFGTRSRAFNTNTVQLGAQTAFHRIIPVEQLESDRGNGPHAYVARLTHPQFGRRPGVVLTMSSNEGDFPPTVDQESVEIAARRLGFHLVRTMGLPDGRRLRIWFKKDPDSL
ncbi:MAG TPA: glycosyltransferase family 39 protein [Solirubrobacterales bacterium]|nr:glycosyltransferase family 39 protein [Solirubrobacterales bacterium]